MDEPEIALLEGKMIVAEDEYFAARPQIDCNDRRRVFQSGFSRGWKKARPDFPHGLQDAQIDVIAENMPGGLDGFLKQWGWRQFARAIEDAHGVGPNALGNRLAEHHGNVMRGFAEMAARKADALQAQLDALMLEYCPDEMTPEQIANWERHQRPVSAEEQSSIEAAIMGPN